jgi:hypothetical protein
VENKKKTQIFWIFVLSGVAIFVGGTYSIYSRINSLAPFLLSQDTDLTDTNPLLKRQQELADLSIKDTDGDGLSDFAELYINKTSPYITDSDSDGLNDKDEIDKGTDPNCQSGKTCSSSLVDANVGNTNVLVSNVNINANTNTTADTKKAADIREELISLGASSEDLAGISDEDLVTLYADALTETSGNNVNSNLSNLNSSQIREILKQNGMTDEELNSIDDATLQQLYQQTLQESSNTSTN